MRCFCHSLQLVVKNGLKKCSNIQRILTKCFKISAKYHQVREFKQFLTDKKYKAIHKPVSTRWNSELKMIRSIVKIELNDSNTALSRAHVFNLNLNPHEHSRLVDLLDILDPFESITDELQGKII